MGAFFIILLIFVALLYLHTLKRGKRFVRAYAYMELLEFYTESGDSEDKVVNMANRSAINGTLTKLSDPDSDNRLIHRAKAYARYAYGGKQLPVIEEAIRKGFLG